MNAKKQMNIGGIAVDVCREKRKTLCLYVRPPDGHVTVSAPLWMSDASIALFVRRKIAWIQQKTAEIESRICPPPREYVSGEALYLWGNRYCLRTVPGGRNSLVIEGEAAVLTTRGQSTPKQRSAFVREWYRSLLKEAIAERLPIWEEKTGLHASAWQTKHMTTHWGSCNTKTGKVWLNLRLAQKAPECLDYVLLHEILHIAEPNHGKAFVARMDEHMPTWRAVKARLDAPLKDDRGM